MITEMKPILMNTEMTKAVLAGRKTQTRRIIKPQPDKVEHQIAFEQLEHNACGQIAPPYRIGTIFYVRETWREKTHNFPIGCPYEYKATAIEDGTPEDGKWKPSIFMPKEAARLFLKVTNARVERIQDISDEDAIAEGVECWDVQTPGGDDYQDYYKNYAIYRDSDYINKFHFTNSKDSFRTLWQSINKKPGTTWESNPYVWVYEFKVIDKPE